MTDQPTREIVVETKIRASLDAIWRALTDAEEIKRWFPLDARVQPGVGGEITYSWGPDFEFGVRIDVWDPPRRLRTSASFPDENGVMRELVSEWRISGEDGAAVVRLVNSGFSTGADWDDQYDGTAIGWRYFFYNLKHYLERHSGKPRTLVFARGEVAANGGGVLETVLGARGLRARPDMESLAPGSACDIALGGARYTGTVEQRAGDRAVALRIPALDDALLFVERESPKRAGVWLSLYGVDAARAAELRAAVDALRDAVMQ